MRISLLQTNIAWEDKQENLRQLQLKLEALRGKTDLAILPEMFSTGFTMKSRELAEPVEGETITTLRKWAKEYQMALSGSYIASDNACFYNRAFFLTPEGEAYFYDKKHLFRMGNEEAFFSAGKEQKMVIPYRGWNICLLVCYEIRFPVWSRNVDNEYDLLIYVANWPIARRHVWDTLLSARAIENVSYVCGINRIGTDGNNLAYNGGSAIYSPRGKVITMAPESEESITTTTLSLEELNTFRQKFPVWMDADRFTIE